MHVPPPNIFQSRVVAPRAKGPLELIFHYVYESSSGDQVFHLRLDEHSLAKELPALDGQIPLSLPHGARRNGSIVAFRDHRELGMFDVAAGGEMS